MVKISCLFGVLCWGMVLLLVQKPNPENNRYLSVVQSVVPSLVSFLAFVAPQEGYSHQLDYTGND